MPERTSKGQTGIGGWLRTNEIFDFAFHKLIKIVEKDLGEYAGKGMPKTWIQGPG